MPWTRADTISAVAAGIAALSLIVSAYSVNEARKATYALPELDIILHDTHNEGGHGAGLFIQNAGSSVVEITKMRIFYDHQDIGSWENFTDRMKREGIKFRNNRAPETNIFSPGSAIKSASEAIPLYAIPLEDISDRAKFQTILREKLDIILDYCSQMGVCLTNCIHRETCH